MASPGVFGPSHVSQKHRTEQSCMHLCTARRLKSSILLAKDWSLARSMIGRISRPPLASRRSLRSAPPRVLRFRVVLRTPGNSPAAASPGVDPGWSTRFGRAFRTFVSKCVAYFFQLKKTLGHTSRHLSRTGREETKPKLTIQEQSTVGLRELRDVAHWGAPC